MKRVAWRVVKRRYARQSFDGEGARRFGSRWNSPGRAVVYASESRALAILEAMVNFEGTERTSLPECLLVPAEFPDEISARREPSALASGWDAIPFTAASQQAGDAWLERRDTSVLLVPSIVVRGEWNLLLNPDHPDFQSVQVGDPHPFALDPRLAPLHHAQ